jgi:molecular chaperone HtpG
MSDSQNQFTNNLNEEQMNTVKIGKNIIDLLTSGMYENPFCVYREYIQNSVDQIDKAVEMGLLTDRNKGAIYINVNEDEKTVEIIDNATGVSSAVAWDILTSIAASEKDKTKQRGFRGIGRLGGIAYCKELIFETSSHGEDVKTVISWDAKELRSIISNQQNKSEAHEVAQGVINMQTLPENKIEHYFKVKLKGVTNHKLLDLVEIRNYLKMVAPIPIENKFILKEEIYSRFKSEQISIDEYSIYVNTEQIYKPYNSDIYTLQNSVRKKFDDIFAIQFEDFIIDGKRIAFGWYGISTQLQQIPSNNVFRGIRLRKGNIQIGDEHTLRRFFKDGRFHLYYVGEIHVISDDIIPNGRRDYFDDTEQLINFESQIRHFSNEVLHKITYDSANIHTAQKKIESYETLKNEYEDKAKNGGFVNKSELNEYKTKIDKQKDDAEKALKTIDRFRERASTNEILNKILNKTIGTESDDNSKKIAPPKIETKTAKIKWKTDSLSKLSRKEQKLVSEIFEVVRTILTPDLAQNLIDKITEKLK